MAKTSKLNGFPHIRPAGLILQDKEGCTWWCQLGHVAAAIIWKLFDAFSVVALILRGRRALKLSAAAPSSSGSAAEGQSFVQIQLDCYFRCLWKPQASPIHYWYKVNDWMSQAFLVFFLVCTACIWGGQSFKFSGFQGNASAALIAVQEILVSQYWLSDAQHPDWLTSSQERLSPLRSSKMKEINQIAPTYALKAQPQSSWASWKSQFRVQVAEVSVTTCAIYHIASYLRLPTSISIRLRSRKKDLCSNFSILSLPPVIPLSPYLL